MKIYFRTNEQRHLFINELSGQISDGMWENARPHNHWEVWCDADTFVDANNPRIELEISDRVPKKNYNFPQKALLDIIGDRMINIVKLAKFGCNHTITREFNEIYPAMFDTITNGANPFWIRKMDLFTENFVTKEHYQEILDCIDYDLKALRKDLKEIKELFKSEHQYAKKS